MKTHPLARAGELAELQHGVVSRPQALAVGATNSSITRWSVEGRWRRVGRGVFIVVGAPRTPEQAVMAAVLVGTSDVVVSHDWAASWWGIDGRRFDDGLLAGGPITFSAGLRASARIPGAVVMRTSSLSAIDIVDMDAHTRTAAALAAADRRRVAHGGAVGRRTSLQRLPTGAVDAEVVALVVRLKVTTPLRTVLDLLRRDVRRGAMAARSLDRLLADGYCDRVELAAVAGRLGARGKERERVEAVVTPRLDETVPTDSELERWFEAFLVRHGLPRPVRQHKVPGRHDVPGRVDFAWPQHRVLLEVDGHPNHWTQAAARASAARDRAALAAGWKPYRVHPGDAAGIEGLALLQDLRAALGM